MWRIKIYLKHLLHTIEITITRLDTILLYVQFILNFFQLYLEVQLGSKVGHWRDYYLKKDKSYAPTQNTTKNGMILCNTIM
jgi:hypothetical protein